MHSLLISLALLILIIALTTDKHTAGKAENIARMQVFSNALFEDSIFPVAIFDRKLKMILTNKSFRSVFTEEGKQSPALITGVTKLWQTTDSKELLQKLQTTGTLPHNPLFISINFKNDMEKLENYIVVFRHVDNLSQVEPFITLTAVDSAHTSNIAEDLIARISEKESNLKKLEEVDRLKSEFLATLSHELKTPLVSIKGYLDLIASEKMGPLTEKQAKALQISLKNASHLNSLISSMLNFARMEAGKLMFDLVHQKLPPRIIETVDSIRPIADNREIQLQTVFANDLPAVIFDPELLHRVMSNLIENSIKFSAKGSAVKIEIARHSRQLIKVQVIDNGCGIPADKLELIKTPFYQIAKSDTRPTSGLGLGLAICEKILVGHGTSLHIDSREGVGTTCSFYLKVADSSV
ncbi:MAG: hypothetical protein CVV42_04350 [Candidatus Riflebacteria bacterium HGW-Riflebacteria-2]|jgi:signal transduction histidine kinase|nr:MAG: hypothetical protein CVV42_04350 [Candidatus Riflebacteria bacterium HGW-Riflebacteria-2]